MLTKEQKINLILDINSGVIPVNARPVFKFTGFFCVSANDRCINDIVLSESEYRATINYIQKNKIGLIIETPGLLTVQELIALISN